MKQTSLSLAALICFGSIALAEDETRSKQFTFLSQSTTNSDRKERFCLPPAERLVEIKGVTILNSNSKTLVDLQPEKESNCVNMVVHMPPANSVCTSIPKMGGGFPPKVITEQVCQAVPTVINFAVNYVSKVQVPPNKDTPSTIQELPSSSKDVDTSSKAAATLGADSPAGGAIFVPAH
jgi:hypothetical protein